MTGDSCGVDKADGSLMPTMVFRLEPGEGISARLGFPHVGKVLPGDQVGRGVEKTASGY